MKTTELKCSNCGSNDFAKHTLTTYRCSYCGTEMIVEEKKFQGYDPITHHVKINIGEFSESARKSLKYLPFIIGGVVAVPVLITVVSVVISAVGVSRGINQTQQDIRREVNEKLKESGINNGENKTITADGREIPDTLSDRKHNPDVKINDLDIMLIAERNTHQYRITGTYENRAGALISNPRLEMDFYDADIKLETAYPQIGRDYLLPGEKATFLGIVTLKRPYTRYTLRTPTSSFGTFTERAKIRITNAQLGSSKTRGGRNVEYYTLGMRLENMSTHTAYVEILVTFFDASKNITGFYSTTVSPGLSPGEKTDFETQMEMTTDRANLWYAEIYGKPESWTIDYNTNITD